METINALQKYVGMTVRLPKRQLGMLLSDNVYIWVFIYPSLFQFFFLGGKKRTEKLGIIIKL